MRRVTIRPRTPRELLAGIHALFKKRMSPGPGRRATAHAADLPPHALLEPPCTAAATIESVVAGEFRGRHGGTTLGWKRVRRICSRGAWLRWHGSWCDRKSVADCAFLASAPGSSPPPPRLFRYIFPTPHAHLLRPVRRL